MRELFIPRNFNGSSLALIEQAIVIIDDMQAKGYSLTLRQLYYQFVTRNWLANTDKNYKRLGSIINDARLAGLIDWDAIVDRTRYLRRIPDYTTPRHFAQNMVNQYAEDLWLDQDNYCEVWIEKDALIGVIERPCDKWRVPYYSCRGYGSQSEMYEAGKRLKLAIEHDKRVTVLCLSDHDPSGLDMTKDIEARLRMFTEQHDEDSGMLTIERVALNIDQVRAYDPPPNPAKDTDSRFAGYAFEFGDESWELDSLDPEVIDGLVEAAILNLVDIDKFNAAGNIEADNRHRLSNVANHFNELSRFIETGVRII